MHLRSFCMRSELLTINTAEVSNLSIAAWHGILNWKYIWYILPNFFSVDREHLGHINCQYIKSLGIADDKKIPVSPCEACALNKKHSAVQTFQSHKHLQSNKLLHIDISDKFSTPFLGKNHWLHLIYTAKCIFTDCGIQNQSALLTPFKSPLMRTWPLLASHPAHSQPTNPSHAPMPMTLHWPSPLLHFRSWLNGDKCTNAWGSRNQRSRLSFMSRICWWRKNTIKTMKFSILALLALFNDCQCSLINVNNGQGVACAKANSCRAEQIQSLNFNEGALDFQQSQRIW
jgi:hypothetical protein